MADKKHAWWTWAIKNSVVMICWTVLAIYFGKWWIVLFSALFLSDLRTKEVREYTVYCDVCGDHIPPQESREKAQAEKKRLGWLTYEEDGQTKDMCPGCQERRINHGT